LKFENLGESKEELLASGAQGSREEGEREEKFRKIKNGPSEA
jgi:hypothetical protein